MKKILMLASVLVAAASCTQAPAPYGVTPTPQQVEWQKMEYNMFMHFGPNTFTGMEWGTGQEKEELFNPTAMDCSQWTSIVCILTRTVIRCGARRLQTFFNL